MESKSNNVNKLKRMTARSYHIRKRLAPKRDECVIYVGNKSNIRGLSKKCDELIKSGKSKIKIHCMGTAISKGTLLALQVCEDNINYLKEFTASTVEFHDENIESRKTKSQKEISKLNNSALEIKLFWSPKEVEVDL